MDAYQQAQTDAVHNALKSDPSLRKDPIALEALRRTYGLNIKEFSQALSQTATEDKMHRNLLGGLVGLGQGIFHDVNSIITGRPSDLQASGPVRQVISGAYDLRKLPGQMVHGFVDPIVASAMHEYDVSRKHGDNILNAGFNAATWGTAKGIAGEALNMMNPLQYMLMVRNTMAGIRSDIDKHGAAWTAGNFLPILAAGFFSDGAALRVLGASTEKEAAAILASRRATVFQEQLATDRELLTRLMADETPYRDLPHSVIVAAEQAEQRLRLYDPMWIEKQIVRDLEIKGPEQLARPSGVIDIVDNPELARLRSHIAEKEAEIAEADALAAEKAKEFAYTPSKLGPRNYAFMQRLGKETLGRLLGPAIKGAKGFTRFINSPGKMVGYTVYLENLKQRDPKAYEAAMAGLSIDKYGNPTSLGDEVAQLMNADSGFFHNAIQIPVDFWATFFWGDPFIAIGKYVRVGRSAYGFTGNLGKYFGGMAIHEAGDATRAYQQYSRFRRTVNFIAHSTQAEIADALRGVFSDTNHELLSALGRASTPEEVLSIFEDAARGMQFVKNTLPAMGWWTTFKVALKGELGAKYKLLGNILQADVRITESIYKAVKEQTGLDIRPRAWLYQNSPPALKANVLLRQKIYRQFIRTPEWFNTVTRELTNNAIIPGSIESINAIGDMLHALGHSRVTVLAAQDALYQTLGNRAAFYETYRNVMIEIFKYPTMVALQGAEYEAIVSNLDDFVGTLVDQIIHGDGGSLLGYYGAGRDSMQVILKEGREIRSAIHSKDLGQLRLPTSRQVKQYQREILSIVESMHSHESFRALIDFGSEIEALTEQIGFSRATGSKIIEQLQQTYDSHLGAGPERFSRGEGQFSAYTSRWRQLLKKHKLALSDANKIKLSHPERLARVFKDMETEVRTALQRYQMAYNEISKYLPVTPDGFGPVTVELEEAAEAAGTTAEAMMDVVNVLHAEYEAAQDMMAEMRAFINTSPDSFERLKQLAEAMAANATKGTEARAKYVEEIMKRWVARTEGLPNAMTKTRSELTLGQWLKEIVNSRFGGQTVKFFSWVLREDPKRGVRNNREMATDLASAYLSKWFKPLALATLGWAERVSMSEFMLSMFRYEGQMLEAHLTNAIARTEVGLGQRIEEKEKSFLRNMFASFTLGMEQGILERMGTEETQRMAFNAMRLWIRHDAAGALPMSVHGTSSTMDQLTADEYAAVYGHDASGLPQVKNMIRGKNYTLIQSSDEGAATAFGENLTRVANDDLIHPIAQYMHSIVQQVGLQEFALNEAELMPKIIQKATERLESGPSSLIWKTRNEEIARMREQVMAMDSLRDADLAKRQAMLDYLDSLAKTPEEVIVDDLPAYMRGPYDAACRNIEKLESKSFDLRQEIEVLESQALEFEAMLRGDFAEMERSVMTEDVSNALDDANRRLRAARSASAILDQEIKNHEYRGAYMLLEHGLSLKAYRPVMQELRDNLHDFVNELLQEADGRLRELIGDDILVLPRVGSDDFQVGGLGNFLDSAGNPVPNQELWNVIFKHYPELWSDTETFGSHFVIGTPNVAGAMEQILGSGMGATGLDALAALSKRPLQSLGIQPSRNFLRLPDDVLDRIASGELHNGIWLETEFDTAGTPRHIEVRNLRDLWSDDAIEEIKRSAKLESSIARQLDVPATEVAFDGDIMIRDGVRLGTRLGETFRIPPMPGGVGDVVSGPIPYVGHIMSNDIRHIYLFDTLMGRGGSIEGSSFLSLHGRVLARLGAVRNLAAVSEVSSEKVLSVLTEGRFTASECETLNRRIGMLRGSNAFEREHIQKIQKAWDDAYKQYEATSRTITTFEDPLYDIFPGLERLRNNAQKFLDRGGEVKIMHYTTATELEVRQYIGNARNLMKGEDPVRKLEALRDSGSATEMEIWRAEQEVMRHNWVEVAGPGIPADPIINKYYAVATNADGSLAGVLSYTIDEGRRIMEIGTNASVSGSGSAQLLAAIKDSSAARIQTVHSSSTGSSFPWHILASRHHPQMMGGSASWWDNQQVDMIVRNLESRGYRHFVPSGEIKEEWGVWGGTDIDHTDKVGTDGLPQKQQVQLGTSSALDRGNSLGRLIKREYNIPAGEDASETFRVIQANMSASELAKTLDFPSPEFSVHGDLSPSVSGVNVRLYSSYVGEHEKWRNIDDYLHDNPSWFKAVSSDQSLLRDDIRHLRMIRMLDSLVGKTSRLKEHIVTSEESAPTAIAPEIPNRTIASVEREPLAGKLFPTNFNDAFQLGMEDWSNGIVNSIVELRLTRDEVNYIDDAIKSLTGISDVRFGDNLLNLKKAWSEAMKKYEDIVAAGGISENAVISSPYSFVPTYGRFNPLSRNDAMRWFSEVSKQMNYRHSLSEASKHMSSRNYKRAYKALMKVNPTSVTRMESLLPGLKGASDQSQLFSRRGVAPEIILAADRTNDEALRDLSLHMRRTQATTSSRLFNKRIEGHYDLIGGFEQFKEDFRRYKNAIKAGESDPDYEAAVEWFAKFINDEPDSWPSLRAETEWARQADLVRGRSDEAASRADYLALVKQRAELGRERSRIGLQKREALRRAEAVPSESQIEEDVRQRYQAMLDILDSKYKMHESMATRLESAHLRRIEMEEKALDRDAKNRARMSKKIVDDVRRKIRADRMGYGPLVRGIEGRMGVINQQLSDASQQIINDAMIELSRRSLSTVGGLQQLRSAIEDFAYAKLSSMPEKDLAAYDRAFFPLAVDSSGDPLIDFSRSIAEHLMTLSTSSSGSKFFPEVVEQMATGRVWSDRMLAKWFGDGVKAGESRPSNFPAREFLPGNAGGMSTLVIRASDALHRNVLSKVVNNVIRNPLFVLEYHNQMESLAGHIANRIYTLEQAEVIAETAAIKNMARYVHDPLGKTVYENNMRILAPFYFAKNQAIRRAIRMGGDDMVALYKYMRLNLAVTDFVGSNQDGSHTFTIPGSQIIGGMGLGLAGVITWLTSRQHLDPRNVASSLRFGFDGSPTSVSSVVITGHKPDISGILREMVQVPFGPIVTFPAKVVNEYLAFHNPKVEQIFSMLLGENAMRFSAMDDLLPNVGLRNIVKGAWGFWRQDNASTYASTEAWVIQDIEDQKFKEFYEKARLTYPALGNAELALWGSREQLWTYYAIREWDAWYKKNKQRIQNQANNRTAVLYALKIISSWSLPVAVSIGERFTENKEFSSILQEKDKDGNFKYPTYILAANEFMKRYPDHIMDLLSHTRYSGARYAQTDAAYEFFGKHWNVVLTYPNVAAYFITQQNTQYSSDALRIEYALKLRERQAPEQFMSSVNVLMGNAMYRILYDVYARVPGNLDANGRLTYNAAMALKSRMAIYGQSLNADWMADKNSARKNSFAKVAFDEMKRFLKDDMAKTVLAQDELDMYNYLMDQRQGFEKAFLEARGSGSGTGRLSSAWYDYCTSLGESKDMAPYSQFILDVLRYLPKPE